MFDDDELGRGPTRKPDDPGADEQAALSRAAREAVRQPADPRLERSFAKLAGVSADEPSHAPTSAASVPLELQAAVDALAARQAVAERALRRVERVAWTGAALAVLATVAALVALARPA